MSETKKTFYVTTPIYYVNDVPHIGHAYCTIGADAIARFKRMDGYEVYFLTGTDEHGQKIAKTAKERGLEPKQLADQVVLRFQEAWKRLNISNDGFIRTTDERHKKACIAFFKKVMDAGHIYKGHYEGWYCLPDEKFLLDSEVIDAKCPDCGRPVERIVEENYFFAMSRFQKALEDYIEKNPGFVQPDSRKNELFSNFIKPGLSDVSITRNTVEWGIPAPVPESSVIYVWFDALLNYITALDWPDGEKYRKFWIGEGEDVHESINIIGKDILRFHATWPTMLMAAGVPLPTRVFGTGYITKDGQKMSKSLGNVVDPFELADTYGCDALRYYLLREVPFGLDGNYTDEAFQLRFNGDLANDMGNLVHRSLTMVEKYFSGAIPAPGPAGPLEEEIQKLTTNYATQARDALSRLVSYCPCTFVGSHQEGQQVHRRIGSLEGSQGRRPGKARHHHVHTGGGPTSGGHRDGAFSSGDGPEDWAQLGYTDEVQKHLLKETEEWGKIPVGQKIAKGQPLFPRIEKKK